MPLKNVHASAENKKVVNESRVLSFAQLQLCQQCSPPSASLGQCSGRRINREFRRATRRSRPSGNSHCHRSPEQLLFLRTNIGCRRARGNFPSTSKQMAASWESAVMSSVDGICGLLSLQKTIVDVQVSSKRRVMNAVAQVLQSRLLASPVCDKSCPTRLRLGRTPPALFVRKSRGTHAGRQCEDGKKHRIGSHVPVPWASDQVSLGQMLISQECVKT